MANEQTCRVHFLIAINHSSSAYELSSLQFVKFARNWDAGLLNASKGSNSSARGFAL